MMALLENPLGLFAMVFVGLVAAVEIGFRAAAHAAVRNDEARHEQAVASRDTLGILLSLLLGFTLAMALPRFDLRKQLVIDEANAIGTASLRSQILPEPARNNMRELLGQYADTRIVFSTTSLIKSELDPVLKRSSQLQSQLWEQAAAAARENSGPVMALFLSSINDVIDLGEKRLAAVENRIPISIWVMLLLISVLTCLTFGYSARSRFWMVSVISPLMIAIVMWLIADLDSPRSGLIRADYSSLVRARNDLRNAP